MFHLSTIFVLCMLLSVCRVCFVAVHKMAGVCFVTWMPALAGVDGSGGNATPTIHPSATPNTQEDVAIGVTDTGTAVDGTTTPTNHPPATAMTDAGTAARPPLVASVRWLPLQCVLPDVISCGAVTRFAAACVLLLPAWITLAFLIWGGSFAAAAPCLAAWLAAFVPLPAGIPPLAASISSMLVCGAAGALLLSPRGMRALVGHGAAGVMVVGAAAAPCARDSVTWIALANTPAAQPAAAPLVSNGSSGQPTCTQRLMRWAGCDAVPVYADRTCGQPHDSIVATWAAARVQHAHNAQQTPELSAIVDVSNDDDGGDEDDPLLRLPQPHTAAAQEGTGTTSVPSKVIVCAPLLAPRPAVVWCTAVMIVYWLNVGWGVQPLRLAGAAAPAASSALNCDAMAGRALVTLACHAVALVSTWLVTLFGVFVLYARPPAPTAAI